MTTYIVFHIGEEGFPVSILHTSRFFTLRRWLRMTALAVDLVLLFAVKSLEILVVSQCLNFALISCTICLGECCLMYTVLHVVQALMALDRDLVNMLA